MKNSSATPGYPFKNLSEKWTVDGKMTHEGCDKMRLVLYKKKTSKSLPKTMGTPEI